MQFGRKLETASACLIYIDRASTVLIRGYKMKDSTKQYFYSVLRQAWQEFRALGDKLGKQLMRTPLPRVLMLCIGLALVVTLIPLALTLFVIFMLVKLFLLMIVMGGRAQRGQNAEQAFKQNQWSHKEAEDAQFVRVEQITYRRDER